METAELDRWSKVHSNAVVINEFLDFLNEQGISLCILSGHTFFPCHKKGEDLIYECYNIDPEKLEKERRELLESIRSKN